MKTRFYLCIILFSATLCAAKNRQYPVGCYQNGYAFNFNVLQLEVGGKDIAQSMYFVHNISDQPVMLYQMRTGEEPFSMHINNSIEQNSWAVYATDENLSKFICTIPNGSSKFGEIVSCQEVLDVCQFTNAVFSPNGYGNYWAINSMSLEDAIEDLRQQGNLLKTK